MSNETCFQEGASLGKLWKQALAGQVHVPEIPRASVGGSEQRHCQVLPLEVGRQNG